MCNLVVKMMSGEDLPDANTSKSFTVVEAYGEVRCERDANGKPMIVIPLECGQLAIYHPEGNTYVLKNGKTVATFTESSVTRFNPEKMLRDLVTTQMSKQNKYSTPDYTWWTQPHQVYYPKNKKDKFVIFEGLFQELGLTKCFDIITDMGWGEVDSFVNVDGKVKFFVYERKADSILPHLPHRTFKEILNAVEVDKINRLGSWEKPRIILPNPTLTQLPLGYKTFKATTGDLEYHEFAIWKPEVQIDETMPENLRIHGRFYPNGNIRTAEELVQFINSMKLGKGNPYININTPMVEVGRVNELMVALEHQGYQYSGNGGLYYYARLTDKMATQQLTSVNGILDQFKDGIPHSFIFDAATIISDNGVVAESIQALSNVLKYTFSGQVNINTDDARYLVQMTYPDSEITDSEIPTKLTPEFIEKTAGIIKNSTDVVLLKALPNRFKPRHLCKVFTRDITGDESNYILQHYDHNEVEGGYTLREF